MLPLPPKTYIDYYSQPNHAQSLAELLRLARLNRNNISRDKTYLRQNGGRIHKAYELQNTRERVIENRIHYSCILRNIERLVANGDADKKSARLAKAICEKGYADKSL